MSSKGSGPVPNSVASSGAGSGSGSVQAVIDEALERGAREADPAEVAAADTSLEELMSQMADPPVSMTTVGAPAETGTPAKAPLAGVFMRTARPLSVVGRAVSLEVRGVAGQVQAEIADGVSEELVALAVQNGDSVIIECAAEGPALVVGVLQTQIPEKLTIRAKRLHLEGEEEVLIRSGLGAIRVRQDGDVELVGSRIAAMSRGLFRLVGRVLRLN